MRIRTLLLTGALAGIPGALAGQRHSLLPDSVIGALAGELSGETAKRNLERIAGEHRIRGSLGFRRAAQHLVERLTAYGLSDARIESLPADGKRFYGTQRSRPPWDAEFAELWLLRQNGRAWERAERLASWDAMPVSLAQDSESGQATGLLVDVGDGTSERDYAGKDVRGNLVLTSQQPGTVQDLAVGRFGAAGIVSYAQNQRTAWWGEDENLVRWGHLETFSAHPTFAFMVSLKQGRALRQRLLSGEAVRLEARVRAGKHPGGYELVTATIPGADPVLRSQEIAFSCHLDHQRPGANDNASGCVAILEAARALAKLIAEGRLARPARTLRFIWPPEIEGTLAMLNGVPGLAERIRAAIHMDMVGGGPETRATFHVTRGPGSLPSFVYDVGAEFGALVNRESAAFAGTGSARYPLVSPEGGKEPLRAEFPAFTMGSDHEVYSDGSFRIPAIYLNDWPDRYIHTNFDTPANIDATKLERAAFIGAASGYYLATIGAGETGALLELVQLAALRRTASMLERRGALPPREAMNLTLQHFRAERTIVASIEGFAALNPAERAAAERFIAGLERAVPGGPVSGARDTAGGGVIYRRNPALKGPMSVFGYDYLSDKYGEERAGALGIFRYAGLWGRGGEFGYEVLNLVDGKRSPAEIRDAVSAIYGPIPLPVVVEFLGALEAAGVVVR
ncbi:MAG TPA: M28 family peptidase [Gemmatimonadales bacterium]|nr:M28 family peptidase [Gemmatimonadales bacterium]